MQTHLNVFKYQRDEFGGIYLSKTCKAYKAQKIAVGGKRNS